MLCLFPIELVSHPYGDMVRGAEAATTAELEKASPVLRDTYESEVQVCDSVRACLILSSMQRQRMKDNRTRQ